MSVGRRGAADVRGGHGGGGAGAARRGGHGAARRVAVLGLRRLHPRRHRRRCLPYFFEVPAKVTLLCPTESGIREWWSPYSLRVQTTQRGDPHCGGPLRRLCIVGPFYNLFTVDRATPYLCYNPRPIFLPLYKMP